MKKVLFVFLSFLLIMPVWAQKKLTLDEAIKIALQGNTTLIKATNQIASNQAQLKNAYGKLLPTVSASGSFYWQRINDAGGTQIDYLGQQTNVAPSQSESKNYSASIGGGITLFDGLSTFANISQQGNNLDAAEYSLEKQKQDIVLQTTTYFYAVLNSDELQKVREENVKYYQKFFETVQERNRLGSVAKADVYTAQVQLGNAELQLIQSQNDYETAVTTLLNYLSLNVLEDYVLVDPFGGSKTVDTDSYMKDFTDVGTMVSAALDNRFDFKAQESTLQSAGNGLTIARSGLLPSLTGSYSYGSSAVSTKDLFNRKVLGLGLSLNIPIFSNWGTETQIEYAKVSELNAEEDLSALERKIKIEVKQGYLDLLAAKKSLDVATNTVTSAEETRKINQERYNLGSGTILDVLQSDRDYTDALRNKINATYDFHAKYDKLKNALGKLDAKKYE